MRSRNAPRLRLWHLPAAVALAAPALAIGVRIPDSLPLLGILALLLLAPSIGWAIKSDEDFRWYFFMERSRPGTVEAVLVRCLWFALAWFLFFTMIVAMLAAMVIVFLLLPGDNLPAPS